MNRRADRLRYAAFMWRFLVAALILIGAAVYFLLFWPLRGLHPSPAPVHGTLAIRDAKIYTSPDLPPIEHGSVLVRDGRIAAVGSDAAIPANARVLPCDGCVVTAGFWNAHVHFTQPKWSFAAWKPAATLNAQLADMLTSRGFTTVVDASSDPRDTISLRRRIESGELAGPKIYTAASALYPPNGIPFYIKESAPFFLLWVMAQPATPAAARRDVETNISLGSDLTKLFTGSYVARGRILPMPLAIAKAAADAAHQHGQLVYSHPSNLVGTRVAIDAGVDVLAHAPDTTDGIDASVLGAAVARGMAMIPTLKMFATTVTTKPAYLDPIYAEVRQFHALGGQLMFGTDVGYMADYRTEDEFRALQQCGLSTVDVLRMLTTAPAGRFGVANEKGTIEPGKLADMVVLDADPAADLTAFARVRYTVRHGRVIYP